MKEHTVIVTPGSSFTERIGEALAGTFNVLTLSDEPSGISRLVYESKARAVITTADSDQLESIIILISTMRSAPQLFVSSGTDEDLNSISVPEGVLLTRLPQDPGQAARIVTVSVESRLLREEEKRSCSINDRITGLLMESCITPGVQGYHFLREAIYLYIKNRDCPSNLHKDIYAQISEQRNATVDTIEHNIRMSITRNWEHSSEQFRQATFGSYCAKRSCSPKPKEFIAVLGERVIRDLRLSSPGI